MTFKPGQAVWRGGPHIPWVPATITDVQPKFVVYRLDTGEFGVGYYDLPTPYLRPRDPALNGADKPKEQP